MERNKQIALRALTGAFIDRDPAVVAQYFAPNYIQHNPSIPDLALSPTSTRISPTSAAWSWRKAI